MFNLNEYEALVTEYSKPIYRYCYLKLYNNKELAEETVNDVFRILYQKWNSIEKGDKIRAYLYRVADMCIKDSVRNHNRYYRKNSSLEQRIENGEFDYVRLYDSYFNNKDADDEIFRIYRELEEEFRELFFLRYIKKLTLNEISGMLGIPYSTLRLRLTKIEMVVRDKIHNETEEIYNG